MFSRVEALNYQSTLSSGRTAPMLVMCSASSEDGDEVDVVVKLSAGCFTKEKALVRECFGACFAAGLEFNVPTTYLVSMSDEFIETITDPEAKKQAQSSNRLTFGSRHLKGFFMPNSSGDIPHGFANTAAEVFALDVMIGNTDRRVGKPNCLMDGKKLALIDHEQAFGVLDELPFARRYPWQVGGAEALVNGTEHIFYSAIKGKSVDFSGLVGRFGRLSPESVQAYLSAIPPEWGSEALAHGQELVDYLLELMKNVAPAIAEIQRVLK